MIVVAAAYTNLFSWYSNNYASFSFAFYTIR